LDSVSLTESYSPQTAKLVLLTVAGLAWLCIHAAALEFSSSLSLYQSAALMEFTGYWPLSFFGFFYFILLVMEWNRTISSQYLTSTGYHGLISI
jgi:hypothetical protein